ncbi:uncharacterized protein E0L32_000281 [Thyridium curvatum]|uniref:Aminoglycoside phosphotransferase domain-containing protein n=1 Tax=Thyridium curvatum TaxID=1093900 RepID=A0A507B810_9PEZI|nr:uncharacterized protein E0L32_000281 [Thyridium curvatum]TPX15947.1 hypothetical protein E0L32_000281 [Thyridium curvatum]
MPSTTSSGSQYSATSMSQVSDSSTAEWEHEAFETFQSRVVDLFNTEFWIPGYSASTIRVERMQGGGFNRVIGVTIETESEEDFNVILRIPRMDEDLLEHDVGILEFVADRTSIPVPRVLSFDKGYDNPIACPYAVHARIPGETLTKTYPHLTHQQRCSVAEQLGQAYREMLELRSAVPGRLNSGLGPELFVSSLQNMSWDSDYPIFHTPYHHGQPPAWSIKDMLTARFDFLKSRFLEKLPLNFYTQDTLDRFIRMTAELDKMGCFRDHFYSIVHTDLQPRNVMATPDTEGEGVKITILDWDGAVFAPMFSTCSPPQWIWDWKDDEEDDEYYANDVPKTQENRELKQIFEDAAGPDFKRWAYGDANRLARRLTRFAYEGLVTNEHYREAEAMLTEWAALYDSRFPKPAPGLLEKAMSAAKWFYAWE